MMTSAFLDEALSTQRAFRGAGEAGISPSLAVIVVKLVSWIESVGVSTNAFIARSAAWGWWTWT
jgi:hypothetical protein